MWLHVYVVVKDEVDGCDCVWFRTYSDGNEIPLSTRDHLPVVGDIVLIRGSLHTRDRFIQSSRQVAVTAVRKFSSDADEIGVVQADRNMMRKFYGL